MIVPENGLPLEVMAIVVLEGGEYGIIRLEDLFPMRRTVPGIRSVPTVDFLTSIYTSVGGYINDILDYYGATRLSAIRFGIGGYHLADYEEFNDIYDDANDNVFPFWDP